jgi:hypothetical protein
MSLEYVNLVGHFATDTNEAWSPPEQKKWHSSPIKGDAPTSTPYYFTPYSMETRPLLL